MDIETVTKIHIEPGDVLIIVVDKASMQERYELAQIIRQRFDPRIVVIISDKPIDVQRLSAEELGEIIRRVKV